MAAPEVPEVVLGDAPQLAGSPWLIQDTTSAPALPETPDTEEGTHREP